MKSLIKWIVIGALILSFPACNKIDPTDPDACYTCTVDANTFDYCGVLPTFTDSLGNPVNKPCKRK